MEKICKNCKHWKNEETDYSDIIQPFDPDTYEDMKMPWEVRYCQSPDILFYERPVKPTQACVVDGSQYHAALITGPEFFCPNFDEKKNE